MKTELIYSTRTRFLDENNYIEHEDIIDAYSYDSGLSEGDIEEFVKENQIDLEDEEIAIYIVSNEKNGPLKVGDIVVTEYQMDPLCFVFRKVE